MVYNSKCIDFMQLANISIAQITKYMKMQDWRFDGIQKTARSDSGTHFL